MAGAVDHDPLQAVAEREHRRHDKRQRQVRVDAGAVLEKVDRVKRHHQRRAVREVDDVQDAVDQGQAERDQCVHGACRHAVQERRQENRDVEHRSAPSGAQREDRIDLAIVARDDDADVTLDHLRHQRLRPGVLAVDELRRTVWHEVVAERAALQRRGDRCAVRALGALDRVGQQPHRGVRVEDLVREEQALGLDALLQVGGALVLRVEPVVAIDDAVGGIGKFLEELVAGGRATEHRIDRLGHHLLLLHRAHQERVLVVVVGRDDDVGIDRLHPQHDVVEVARRVRVLDDLLDLEAVGRQLAREQLGGAGAEQALLVDDHHRLGGLAGDGVEDMQVVDRDLRAYLVARAEPEGVLQAALDDLVGHPDVDHVRQPDLGRRLCGGQADRAGVRADHGGAARLVHLLDLCRAGLRRALRIAQQHLELGIAEAVDARPVHVLDGHQRALAALLSRKGQRSGDGVQDAHLERLRLGTSDERKRECRRGRGRLAQEGATLDHARLLWKVNEGSMTHCELAVHAQLGLDCRPASGAPRSSSFWHCTVGERLEHALRPASAPASARRTLTLEELGVAGQCSLRGRGADAPNSACACSPFTTS